MGLKISRRGFLWTSVAAIAGVTLWRGFGGTGKSLPGELLGPPAAQGHRLRNEQFPEPGNSQAVQVVIVGGGIAGLGAAYRLLQRGIQDIVLLELDSVPGGNARSGANDITAYPWGAHYVPIPNEETTEVRRLFEDLQIIRGYNAQNLPIYNELYLCADPHERLLFRGRWQEGLVPNVGLGQLEKPEFDRFFQYIEQLRQARGQDGRRAFAIPVDESSRDEQWLALDSISMAQWLQKQGYTSKPLLWYLGYCCRDDYGATLEETSAWAGLHYFASRNGKAANSDGQSVLTWPEGNGFLVNQLVDRCPKVIKTNSLVYNLKADGQQVQVDCFDTSAATIMRYQAKAVVLAVPRFVASKLLSGDTVAPISSDGFHYAPWAVANITLDRLPEGTGAPLSWDNVVYNSPFLGYVVATHQKLNMMPRTTVITYYWPLTHTSPVKAREEALSRSHSEWQGYFLDELLRIHPELRGAVKRIDVWVWGHGMIRPTPGFIWGKQRQKAVESQPPVYFAHSDLSGISNFEEAYTRGVQAANAVAASLAGSRAAT